MSMDEKEAVEKLHSVYGQMKEELSQVIVGQEEVVEQVLMAIFCRGHALLVGVPGLAKTLLVSTVARALDLSFKRIQFTPDLMPADITGTDVLEMNQETGRRSFRFVEGPVFANMILADEINRTPPKTQAALLEAMQEHHVTVGEKTCNLPKPFFVLATQNPIEQEGTYPLPEAQLDRFMFNILISYPSRDEEVEIVKSTTSTEQEDVTPVLSAEDLFSYQNLVRNVPVADNVIEYAVDFVNSTRTSINGHAKDKIGDWLEWGAGPRASMYLILGAKAKALLDGRTTPDISDVQQMLNPILRHRIIPSFNAEADGISRDDILEKIRETAS